MKPSYIFKKVGNKEVAMTGSVKRRLVTVLVSLLLLSLWAWPGECRRERDRSEQPLVIAVTPEQNIFRQIERYTPVISYVSRETGISIKLKAFTSCEDAIRNAASSSIHGAFFGSFACALAQRQVGVEALARPEALDGTSTYHGLIFVRKDSGIRNAGDMKGKRFAFVDRATTAGYLLPLFYLSSKGIRDYMTYLGEVYFAGTHEDAIYDVLRGQADVGAAKNTVFHRLAARDHRIRSELKILSRSPDMPETTLVLTPAVDPHIRERIREALLNMHDSPAGRAVLRAFGAKRFVATVVQDYGPIFDYSREVGIDLERYNPKADR